MKKKPIQFIARYRRRGDTEWLPVSFIDYIAERVMLRKNLETTHKTYVADFDEVIIKQVRGRNTPTETISSTKKENI